MWVAAHTQAAYPDKAAMADDVITILREELADLAREGADFVQFDEPVLSEVVHSGESKRRTFMCATLATRRDATAELAYATELMQRVLAGFEGRFRTGLHVCRGTGRNARTSSSPAITNRWSPRSPPCRSINWSSSSPPRAPGNSPSSDARSPTAKSASGA